MITCKNCNKKFNIDRKLIPDNGRLLQCGKCNHKWFFKNDVLPKVIHPLKNNNMELFEKIKKKTEVLEKAINQDNTDKTTTINKEKDNKRNTYAIKDKKRIISLNLILVLIISFVALIIIIDTFKSPLSLIFPKIEFFLYNLYESIKDIKLFIKDLI